MAANNENTNNYFGIILVLVRGRKLIIISTAIAAFLSVALSILSIILPPEKSFLPNKYTSSAIMIINDQDKNPMSDLFSSSELGNLASLAGMAGTSRNYGAFAEYLTSTNTIIDAVIQKFNLIERYDVDDPVMTNTRNIVKDTLLSEYDSVTGIFEVSFTDIDPELSMRIVNHIVELLDLQFLAIGGNRNLIKKQQLEEKLAEVNYEMNRIENEIEIFQTKYGVISIESLASEQISIIAEVRSELLLKEMAIETYSSMTKVEDPQMRRLKAEKDYLRNLLDELNKGVLSSETGLPGNDYFPKIALEYSHLERDLMIQVEIYKLLIQQYELTKLELTGSDPVFQVFESAQIPDTKSGPSRGIFCIVVTFSIFMLSIFLSFLIEYIHKVKNNPSQMGELKNAWENK
ncbi:MAG: hypothetical protein JXA91_01720 [Candidatus Thermoplasmatota archaeon]|nr:hypothetical protein [Candidatus Thermoplasmatota archaeon]